MWTNVQLKRIVGMIACLAIIASFTACAASETGPTVSGETTTGASTGTSTEAISIGTPTATRTAAATTANRATTTKKVGAWHTPTTAGTTSRKQPKPPKDNRTHATTTNRWPRWGLPTGS